MKELILITLLLLISKPSQSQLLERKSNKEKKFSLTISNLQSYLGQSSQSLQSALLGTRFKLLSYDEACNEMGGYYYAKGHFDMYKYPSPIGSYFITVLYKEPQYKSIDKLYWNSHVVNMKDYMSEIVELEYKEEREKGLTAYYSNYKLQITAIIEAKRYTNEVVVTLAKMGR